MSRIWPAFLLLAIAQPALAGGRDAPAYGPMKRWHGIGYKFGYEDRVEKDGSWRIDAATHGDTDAIDVALYRAAERARDAGYRYVALLGGRGSRSPGIDAATLYARPSHDAVPPVGCRSRKVTSCYTADVAEILRILGGPGGTQPGVAIIDHYDEFGREVRMSGYGTGAVATLVPGGHAVSHVTTITEIRSKPNRTVAPQLVSMPPVPMPPAPTPRTGYATTRSTIAHDRFEQARRANQPVRGGNPAQGWTISD